MSDKPVDIDDGPVEPRPTVDAFVSDKPAGAEALLERVEEVLPDSESFKKKWRAENKSF